MSHSNKPAISQLPRGEVTQDYIDQLVNAIEQALEGLRRVQALEGSRLWLSNLPTSANMEKVGTVYDEDGYLRIVRANIGYPPSYELSIELGTVTVSTS